MKNNKKPLTPVSAIRKYCISCCCGQLKEVKICNLPDCELYPFRMGKNPNRGNKQKNNEKE